MEMHIRTKSEILFTSPRVTKIKSMKILRVDKHMEQTELSYVPGGIIKWYNYFGTEFGSFYEVKIHYHMIWQFYSLGVYSRKLKAYAYKRKRKVQECSSTALFIENPQTKNNLNVH